MSSQAILENPRPWAFSQAELTAGLRRRTGDPSLRIERLEEMPLPNQRPSLGRIRALQVTCQGATGEHVFDLVVKEVQQSGNTRAGTATVGQRELFFYQSMAEQLPVRIPRILAAEPMGDWLVLERLHGGRQPEKWTADDYRLATVQLVLLHDRFWNLDDDLRIYPWLQRPLDADLEVNLKVANTAIRRLSDQTGSMMAYDSSLGPLFAGLIESAGWIAARLKKAPATLTHGDYWPGNIHIDADGGLTVLDWQQAGIGPGVLDLVSFIHASRWYFDPLPVEPQALVEVYRATVQETIGQVWTDGEWADLWDFSLMWVFLMRWIDTLANTPAPLLRMRIKSLEDIWLTPVRQAVARHLTGGKVSSG